MQWGDTMHRETHEAIGDAVGLLGTLVVRVVQVTLLVPVALLGLKYIWIPVLQAMGIL